MVTYLYILELDIGREVQWRNKGLRRPSLLKYLLFTSPIRMILDA